MPQTDIRKTSRRAAMTDIEVEPVDAPIRVELTGTIGGDRDARIRVGQLSIGYKDGRVLIRNGLLDVAVWPCTLDRARFAAAGHTAAPVLVEPESQSRGRGRGAAKPAAPLVRVGPGGDYVEDYHG